MRTPLPDRRRSENHKVKCRGNSIFVTVGFYNDGRVGEIFIDTAKAGTELHDMMSSAATMASLALQSGAELPDVVRLLGGFGDSEISKCVASVLGGYLR